MAAALPVTTRVSPRPLVIAALLLAGWGAVFHETIAAMAGVWWTSASFAHGPLVPVASAWLAWRQRAAVASAELRPWWPAAVAVAALALAWAAARIAGVNAAEQFAAVASLVALLALVFGPGLVRALAFPLGFLFFAVPFGTFLIPHLMEWTADVTVWAIRLSGIPALREGMNFTLPTGRWSVVESCSGLRYLLAALPLATLYAWLTYRSARKRVAFVLFMLAAALAGNWLRAYLIVLIGHLSEMRVAVGPDHLVFGWVLFGVLISLPFWIGSRWRDPEEPVAAPAGKRVAAWSPSQTRPGPIGALALGLVLLSAAPPAVDALRSTPTLAVDLQPVRAVLLPGSGDPAPSDYRPSYGGGVASVSGRLSALPDVRVNAFQYARQHRTGEMVSSANRLLPGDADSTEWRSERSQPVRPSDYGARAPRGTVTEDLVSGPSGRWLVWHWFEVGPGEPVTSPARAKFATLREVLARGSDESVAWFVWAPAHGPIDETRRALARGASIARSAADRGAPQ
jgi:exosortase A